MAYIETNDLALWRNEILRELRPEDQDPDEFFALLIPAAEREIDAVLADVTTVPISPVPAQIAPAVASATIYFCRMLAAQARGHEFPDADKLDTVKAALRDAVRDAGGGAIADFEAEPTGGPIFNEALA